ncbi:MAG TPA: protein kinase, partial [Pirellulales bacterium]|nr:protein kinase [Pirellulales bacterium]
MTDAPSKELVELLSRLGLATAPQAHSMRGRVSRLARGVPAFESVWVDALAQARLLTPFQAAELHEGRGAGLELGTFALHRRLASLGYAEVFSAREVSTRQWARLAQFEVSADRAADVRRQLDDQVRLGAALKHQGVMPFTIHGTSHGSFWAASRDQRGQAALAWLVEHGRFPPDAVLEIARQMSKTLAVCHEAGVFHGDLGAGQVLLDPLGSVWLTEAGLRVIVRPHEGFAQADLPPDAYDYLPPERVTSEISPNAAGDLYACGCLWWHLLAGRPPIPGGTGLMKLRSGQTAKIADIRDLAPDVHPLLAAAIDRLTDREANRRPASAAQLLAELGPPTPAGRRRLARCMGCSKPRGTRAVLMGAMPLYRAGSNATVLAAVAGAGLALVIGTWPMWGGKWLQAIRRTPSESPAAVHARPSDGEVMSPDQLAAKVSVTPGSVVPANYLAGADGAVDSDARPFVDLPTGRPTRLDTLALKAGQTIRGAEGKAALVLVPREGLTISAEDLRFENVDFVWDNTTAATAADRETALLRLNVLRATFCGCSFQARPRLRRPLASPPVAIRWRRQAETTADELALPTGELEMTDCVISGVSAGFACAGEGAMMIRLSNVLHLGHGPLMELRRSRRRDEPLALNMSHVTLRGSEGLVACHYQELGEEPGTLAIQASDCAFFPAPGAALLSFHGDERPSRLLDALEWTGQGSVVALDVPLAVWHATDGTAQRADEAAVQVEGIVRTAVGFAGA